MRGGAKSIAVRVGSVDSGSGAREALRESLAPLSFGAAYKVLDKLVEHVLWDNGHADVLESKRDKLGVKLARTGFGA